MCDSGTGSGAMEGNREIWLMSMPESQDKRGQTSGTNVRIQVMSSYKKLS